MNPHRSVPPRARGTTLVEAVVALAVMAFGMLAVVGAQTTLRLNADVAKQRSEAVRLGQQAIEQSRAFGAIESPATGQTSFDAIAEDSQTVTGYTTNTTYTIDRDLRPLDGPERKELRVVVEWNDRSDVKQEVVLDSIIAASDPRVALLLGARPNGIPERLPKGRSPLVPQAGPDTVDVGGETRHRPAPGVVWLFDTSTGVITSVCSYAGADLNLLVPATHCVNQPSVLISGFVRFSFGTDPSATSPADNRVALALLAIGKDGSPSGECFTEDQTAPALQTAYACRVPTGVGGWTGSVDLAPPPPVVPPAPPPPAELALNTKDVCRYVNAMPGNPGHPLKYTALKRSLTDQNFLVVDEGITCPPGTEAHQPPPP